MSAWKARRYHPNYKPEELCFEPLSPLTASVWASFVSLSDRREWGQGGPHALAWRDIQAWQDVTKSQPSQWEINTILLIDNTYLRAWSENNKP